MSSAKISVNLKVKFIHLGKDYTGVVVKVVNNEWGIRYQIKFDVKMDGMVDNTKLIGDNFILGKI